MNETLQKATQLLQNGEAEEALLLLNELGESSTESEQLKQTCKKVLSEQYLYLLREAKKENDLKTLNEIISKYKNYIGEEEALEQYMDIVSKNDLQEDEKAGSEKKKGRKKTYITLALCLLIIVLSLSIVFGMNSAQNKDNTEIGKLVKKAFKTEMSYRDFLLEPEVKDYIIRTKSQKFYDMAIYYTDAYSKILKNDKGVYCAESMDEENGSGTKFYYDGKTFDVTLYLINYELTKWGEFNISPWEKGYNKGDDGKADMNSPCYFYYRPFTNVESEEIEVIEMRIDNNGLRFINWSISNTKHAKLKIETLDGEIWNVPIESSNGIIRIGWDNNAIFRLINLLSNEIVNVYVDYIDAFGHIHSYFTPFVAMNQIGLVELDFMYNIGAISKVSRTN